MKAPDLPLLKERYTTFKILKIKKQFIHLWSNSGICW
jgi:hypothetical protein